MVNPYSKSFNRRANNRFANDSDKMTMTDWVCSNTTLAGRPFTVKGYEFQEAILNDMHPNLDVIKCSQVGLTEVEIRKALAFLKRNRGVKLIFSLPNEKLYDKISKSRIQPIVNKDKVFNPDSPTRPVRSKEVMQFDDSWLYVTACTEGDATSTSADAVFNDEVDISPQDMLVLFNSRLQNSEFKINQRFSTPSFPSFGIDAGFQASDQHLNLIKCVYCNHWNWPELARRFINIPGLPDHIEHITEIDDSIIDDIDIVASHVQCEKCKSPLELGDPSLRQWVPKYPGRSHARGYHVTPFSTSRLPVSYILTQLLKYKKRDYLRGFHNTVLGLPYSDGNIRLELDAINACFTSEMMIPEISRDLPVWAGIDVGQTCHIVLGTGTCAENMRAFAFKTIHIDKLVATVEQIDKDYNLVGGSIDRHPYEPTADEVMRKSKGKIIPVEYRGREEVKLSYNEFDDLTHAQVDRTSMLDTVVRVIKNRSFQMSGFQHFKSIIIEHLRDMVRDEQPEKPATWVKLTQQDHFFHSIGFLLVAPLIREIVRLHQKDEIRTMALIGVVDVKDGTKDLLGRKNKPLDSSINRGHIY